MSCDFLFNRKLNPDKWTGLILHFVLTSVIFLYFYSTLFFNLNSVCFSSDGDGFKSYYGAIYHIKYDKNYLHSQSQNYPYGESVFVLDNQPLLANSMKWISNHIVDVSPYTIGVINFCMLISIVLASLIIYAILRRLKVGFILASLSSIAISFLSPQIDRFGGHFSLSYICAIPAILYLLLRHYETAKLKWSFFTATLCFVALLTHAYIFAFYAIIIIVYLFTIHFSEKERFGRWPSFLLNLFLQIILPYVIFYILSSIDDPVNDRTNHPFGILFYRAYPESIFLPIGKPYGSYLSKIMTFNHIDWEGWSYIGLVASVSFLIIFIDWIKLGFKFEFKRIIQVCDQRILTIFFWAGFIALLYSFGIPYIFDLKSLINYIGPLAQFRSIARFAWVFYYVFNILVVYIIWQKSNSFENKFQKLLIIVIPLIILMYDAYLNVRGRQNLYNNKIEAIKDYNNLLDENKWVKKIHTDKYQAILPLPYYHIGSENIWIGGGCGAPKANYLVALKTGLPSMGVMLGRTSLSQTYSLMPLVLEPYRKPSIIEQKFNSKPLLLVVTDCDQLTEYERNLIKKAVIIDSTASFKLYELSVDVLKKSADSLYYFAKNKMSQTGQLKASNYSSSDTLHNVIINHFDENKNNYNYLGNGALTGNCKDYNVIYQGAIPLYKEGSEYVVSFWFGNFTNDVYPRTTFEFCETDSLGNLVKSDYQIAAGIFKIIDGSWALLEYKFKLAKPSNNIKVTMWNDILSKGNFYADELLIRPVEKDIYQETPHGIVLNNRFYPVAKK
jgi:hypothetical protein